MNTKKLFVIACYYDGSNNSIFECVKSIQKYYKYPQIAVIDSNSPDKSYFKKLKEKKVTVYNAKNTNYDTGAYWYAYNKFKNVNFFYFLQDSVIFKKNLSKYEKNDLTTFRYFLSLNKIGGRKFEKTRKNIQNRIHDLFVRKKGYKNHDIYGFDFEKQIEWCKIKLNKTDYFMPKVWLSVFGPIFMCKKTVMKKLYKKRFHKILPTNKLEQMCMERLFGIAFQQEGYDASNSIQGEHFTTPFETLNFRKKFFKRK